jgi:hypothetical protein
MRSRSSPRSAIWVDGATAADNLRLSDTKKIQAIIDVSLYVG